MNPIRILVMIGLCILFTSGFSTLTLAESVANTGLTLSSVSGDSRVSGQMPLFFIANQGQLDTQVKYSLHTADKSFFFTAKGVTLTFKEPQSTTQDRRQQQLFSGVQDSPRYWAARLEFIDASNRVTLKGQGTTLSTINYFKGNPEQWQTAIPTCTHLVYQELWPGVDLVFSLGQGQLKYTFLVDPGADPDQIQMAYRGAEISITENGELKVATPFGGLVDQVPVAWQGENMNRRIIPCSYALTGDSEDANGYGFTMEAYDPSRPLILDPGFIVYSGFLGSSVSDFSRDIVVDSSGHAYITGNTTSADFPRTVGLPHAGNNDVFVAKVRPDGTGLVYSGFIGGDSDDYGYSIAVDKADNAYITGTTSSSDFPHPIAQPYNGGVDAFVTKISASGTSLVYSGFIGGTGYDGGSSIAVDDAGNAYVTGTSLSDNFPRTVGLPHAGGSDVFVTKVRPDGAQPVYSGFLGGSKDDYANDIAIDSSGSAYVTGTTFSDNFPHTVGLPHAGNDDVFVAKVVPNGTSLAYSGFLGGTNSDQSSGIAIDTTGNVYVTGKTESDDFPHTVGLPHAGSSDVFVAKVQSDGAALVYSGFIGGSSVDVAYDIAVDSQGSAYVTGETHSADFPRTMDPAYAGSGDVFVTKVRPDGSALVYSSLLGDSEGDIGMGIAVDTKGYAYITGYTESTNFPRTVGLPHAGARDVFVAKLKNLKIFPWILFYPACTADNKRQQITDNRIKQ